MRPFYFLHIPKTAGTSVKAWLQAQGGFCICPDSLWTQLLRREREALGNYDLFAGHFYTSLAGYLHRDLSSFTFLRHPVEKSISHYLHIMRHEAHYRAPAALGGFMAFMQDPHTMPMLYNFQTRALSMEFDVPAVQENLENKGGSAFLLEQRIESTLDGYASAVNLPRRWSTSTAAIFVGLTEHLNISLSKLQRVLGTEGTASPPPVLNVADNKPELSQLMAR